MLSIYNDNLNTIAVQTNNREYSYNEFVETVNFYKNEMLNNKIKRIVIDLPQSFIAYALMWAAYLSEVTFCCLNHDNPIQYKKKCIDAFHPNYIFDKEQNIESHGILKDFLKIEGCIKQHDAFDVKKVAYVLFTSGSTGEPKGVMVKRAALDHFVFWCHTHYLLSPGDVYGQFSNISFDLGVGDVFFGLSRGARMIPVSGLMKLIPAQVMKRYQINFWHSVPSVIDIMEKQNTLNYDNLKTLKEFTFCGEPLYDSQISKLFRILPDSIIWNTYGPTEATIFCSAVRLNRNNYLEYSQGSVSIGEPLDGFFFHLIPNEENFELVIESEYIAMGYLEPDFTGGFIRKENESYYSSFKTGDIVTQKDNLILFVGRKDTQVKINGFRIDLNEIDFTIRKYFDVVSCSIVRKDMIITVLETDKFDAKRVYAILKANLPSYYIPSKLVYMTELPKNANGKISRKELLDKVNQRIELYEKL